MLIRLGALLLAMLIPVLPAGADSSSPLLAAYYDRQMAIVGQTAYGWQGTDRPWRIHDAAVQVGVGRSSYFVLTTGGALLKFGTSSPKSRLVADGVARFAAVKRALFFFRRFPDRSLGCGVAHTNKVPRLMIGT